MIIIITGPCGARGTSQAGHFAHDVRDLRRVHREVTWRSRGGHVAVTWRSRGDQEAVHTTSGTCGPGPEKVRPRRRGTETRAKMAATARESGCERAGGRGAKGRIGKGAKGRIGKGGKSAATKGREKTKRSAPGRAAPNQKLAVRMRGTARKPRPRATDHAVRTRRSRGGHVAVT